MGPPSASSDLKVCRDPLQLFFCFFFIIKTGALNQSVLLRPVRFAPRAAYSWILSQRGMCSPSRAHISSVQTGNSEGLTGEREGGESCAQLRL